VSTEEGDLYRKRPVTVRARRVGPANAGQLAAWCEGTAGFVAGVTAVEVPTLEGTLTARDGDWIVKGITGEFWPVRADIFPRTYDRAAGAEATGETPGQAVYEAQHAAVRRRFPGIAEIRWDELSDEARAEWELIAEAGLTAALRRADAAAVLDDDLEGDDLGEARDA